MLGIIVAGAPSPPVAETPKTTEPQAPADGDCANLGIGLIQELTAVFRGQGPDGSLPLAGTQGFFARQPLLATLSGVAYELEQSPAFLSQSASAIARYYGFLFEHNDSNGNLLLESATRLHDGTSVDVEDVGTNSLLSLDLVNLSLMYVKLRKPVRALYWYEGARTLQQNIVTTSYDSDTGYFYPHAYRRGMLVRNYDALSALPLLFDGLVGDNHAVALVSEYLLKDQSRLPESPSFYICEYTPDSEDDATRLTSDAGLVRTWLLLDVLRQSGHAGEAKTLGLQAADNVARYTNTALPASAHERFLRCRLSRGATQPLVTPTAPMEIFEALIRSKRRLGDAEIVRTEQSMVRVRALIAGEPEAATDLSTIETSIRNVYWAVSRTREQARTGAFLGRDDVYEMSGLDPLPALERLLDDVTGTLRRAENRLFELRHRASGLYASATILDEAPVLGNKIEIKWVLGARTGTVDIRAAAVYVGEQTDSIVGPGETLTVAPGAQPTTLNSVFKLTEGRPQTLLPLVATLVIDDANGVRTRFNANRSVFLHQPVSLVAEFPQGQIMSGTSVPVRVKIVKRVPTQMALQLQWYSTSGITLKEGRLLEYQMGVEQDTAAVALTAIIPSPCRPGVFPFKMKFSGNGADLGTISAELYRPYQWVLLGPFTAGEQPLDTPHPPERNVDLLKGYTGQGRLITWQLLGPGSLTPTGEVALRGWQGARGVGYLYTVIQSSDRQEVPVVLAANTPTALFVNGVRVLDGPVAGEHHPTYARVQLKEELNEILIKVHGDESSVVYFNLGDERNLAPDEFNNNLWELVDGFGEFHDRSQQRMALGDEAQKIVTLRFIDADANSVSVIGSFNGWSPENSRLSKVDDQTWEITLSIAPGKYTYRFLINNRQQVLDPSSAYSEPDGYGGKNSVLFVKK